MLSICRVLAAGGFSVRCLATTAVEGSLSAGPEQLLFESGIEVVRAGREFQFRERGVSFRLLRTGATKIPQMDNVFGRAINAAFEEELRRSPDILFTFWGSSGDPRRFQKARQAGAKVVVGLRNHSYADASYFRDVDAVLTPTEALTEHYRRTLGIQSTAIPSLLDEADVIATDRDPIFITMVNPSPEKGIAVMARLAEELSRRRPDLPILVVESRGSAGNLVECGLRGGFDLRHHENIMMAAPTTRPKDLFQPARILLVPSLQDAGPRVIPEAMLNGVPVFVSDRGGLPELARNPTATLPLPADLSAASCDPVGADVVEPWIRAVLPLMDDESFYSQQCNHVRQLAQVYRTSVLSPRYIRFFEDLLADTFQQTGI